MKALILILITSLFLSSCGKVNVQASVDKASVLLKQGKYKEAEDVISPCLDAAKTNPRILVLLCLATSGQDKAEVTNLHIDEALSLLENSEDAEALTHLGQAYLNIKEYKKAQEVLERSYKLAGDNEYTAALLIEAELLQFNTLRSYSLRNKYLNLAEKFPVLKDSINYLNLKAVTNALGPNFDRSYVTQTLSQAYSKEKNNPAVLLNLAYIHDQVYQNYNRAIRFYESYLTAVKLLPPEHTQANNVKRRLTHLRNRN